jgi:hypothetical protein
MKTLGLFLSFLVAVSARAQLPATTPARAGFDPERLEVLHAITKRFVSVAFVQHFPFNEHN